jgi:hypothetical protein
VGHPALNVKDQIVEKLRAVLSDEIDSECKVVYILCETRKLLDKYPTQPVPVTLKMYCHWALHIDLTNPGTTASDAFVPFDLVWDIVLLDGRTMSVQVYAAPLPNGNPMLVHGIHVH